MTPSNFERPPVLMWPYVYSKPDLSSVTIGDEFHFEDSPERKWRVTDVGNRVIVAIELCHPGDLSWYNGPIYAVPEHSFDEDDQMLIEWDYQQSTT